MGYFFCKFVVYDPNNNSSIWRECMRIRILVDIKKPLKRKKICRKNGTECIVQCKYKRLGEFCFICGMVTHTERFYSKRLHSNSSDLLKEWRNGLKAPPRRVAGQERSMWLRKDCDVDWGNNFGIGSYYQHYSDTNKHDKEGGGSQELNSRAKNQVVTDISGKAQLVDSSNILKVSIKPNSFNRLNDEEIHGLNIEERQKRTCGLSENEYMETDGDNGSHLTESTLSNIDCADFVVP